VRNLTSEMGCENRDEFLTLIEGGSKEEGAKVKVVDKVKREIKEVVVTYFLILYVMLLQKKWRKLSKKPVCSNVVTVVSEICKK